MSGHSLIRAEFVDGYILDRNMKPPQLSARDSKAPPS